MPADQRGETYTLADGRVGLRYRDRDGIRRRTKEKFPSASAARRHFRDVIEPQLLGRPPLATELTLDALVELYLERHAAHVRPRTIETLRERLRHARTAFGHERLEDLERMAGELASWQATLPERSRYGVVQALRQTLAAAVRWEYMARNPAVLAGSNPEPAPRTVRAFSFEEVSSIEQELDPRFRPLPSFAAATGLRPEEWQALERQDIDRGEGLLHVRRSVSSGELVELGKTGRSRRQVPLSPRAIDALDQIPPRLDTTLLFPAPAGGLLNLDNWRRRTWAPAIEASGVERPARIYDLRSTYASNQLAAGVSMFELAAVMGTSARMIEKSYGVLLEGAIAGIAARQAAYERAQETAAQERS